MIALPNYFPHGCAAPNGCDNPACGMCRDAVSLDRVRDAADEKAQDNPERDGQPTLSGERERRPAAFRKRHRAGPNRSNA
jgi:hypothetical protein